MTTPDKILDIALQLFNEHGTAAVSTNHIASMCGISPGNLYYHFRHKQEIIRRLFERLYALWDSSFLVPLGQPLRLTDLTHLVQTNYQIIWQYRFAYRELVPLLNQDPQLRASFLEVRQRGYAGFQTLFQAFVTAGILREPDDPAVIPEVMELCWLISEFWITSLEVNGRPVNSAEMAQGVKLMLRVLQPYLR